MRGLATTTAEVIALPALCRLFGWTRACCALAVTLVLVLAVAAPASARPQYRGVQLHSLWWESSDADMDRELDLAQQTGANVVRVDVAWGSLEDQGKGRFSPWYSAKLDRFVAGAAARGMKVIAGLGTTPCWASSAPDTIKQNCQGDWWGRGVAAYAPSNPADYADIARWVTSRYGTQLAALEIWNEPNLASKQFLNAPDQAATYSTLLKAAYPAAKAGNADVPVLAGALSSTDQAFLAAMYANGVKGSYDAISVHPYADPGFVKLGAFRAVQQANGDNTPIWATEFGWPTGTSTGWSVSETAQANNIRQAFADLDRLPYVQAATVYNLRDKGTNAAESEDNFGLVRRDYSPKAAYQALKDALGAPPASAAAPAAATPQSAAQRAPTITLRVRSKRGTSFALGRTAPKTTLRLRMTRCAHTSRTWKVKSDRKGKFTRRLGRSRRLRGCRVRATVA
jgi:hypothetical protein